MCTVTYLPLGQNNFIITSNRDERKTRPTLPPMAHNIHGQQVYFPKDSEAGGTWFATSAQHTVVLLNGADKKHHHNPPYRLSRGLVMLDYYAFLDAEKYAAQYDFEGIEPFTLVIINPENKELYQLRWNEVVPQLVKMPFDKPAIWSSATLYDEETRQNRARWFAQWLQAGNEYTVDNILKFHHFGGTGDIKNDLVMNRENKVQTVSITSFEKQNNHSTLWYEDLVNKQRHTLTIL